jgi:RNA polymerase sigma factor (sigma-70 family)
LVKRDRYANISDQQLLENYYQDHDNEWLGILLERYTLLLLGVCMKYLKNEEEARDTVQQVFLKAITELGKYRVQFFKSWLYMVAKNHCLMRLRDRRSKTAGEINEEMLVETGDPSIDSTRLDKERRLDLMSSSLGELNNEQRSCVTMFYLEKRSYQEISEATGFSIMQVKSYIQNGKRNLKISLEKKIREAR